MLFVIDNMPIVEYTNHEDIRWKEIKDSRGEIRMTNENQPIATTSYSSNPMPIKEALDLLYRGILYDRKGDLTWSGYRALDTLKGVKLKEVDNCYEDNN